MPGILQKFRAAFVVVSSIGLVICLFEWARSYFQIENWTWASMKVDYEVFSHWGALYAAAISNWSPEHGLQYRPASALGWDRWGDESLFLLDMARPHVPTILNTSLRGDGLQPCLLLVIPYWLFCIILGSAPAIAIANTIRRRHRARIMRCIHRMTGGRA